MVVVQLPMLVPVEMVVVALGQYLVMELPELPTQVAVVVAEEMRVLLKMAETVAQASSSLPTHNSSHPWHLLMQA